MKKKSKILQFLAFIYFFSFFLSSPLFSYDFSAGLYKSELSTNEYEINIIRFQGNDNFSYDELYNVVTTRESDRSVFHKVLYYYNYQIDRNPPVKSLLPKLFLSTLNGAIEGLSYQIRFFSDIKAEEDLKNLQKFYNMHGFHKATFHFTFLPDSALKANVLCFHIYEDTSYTIRSLELDGLDSVPDYIKSKIEAMQPIRIGRRYNELLLMRKVTQINRLLLNEGYFSTSYQTPVINIDTVNKTDSIYVKFLLSSRKKFGDIVFIDSLRGQKQVTNSMKSMQLTFKNGDWYSRDKVNESIDNLFSIGTFEAVAIDTSSHLYQMTDSTLAFHVFTQYRKQQEYGFSFLVNQTQIEKETNIGLDISYFDRNIGGIAQVFNPFARVLLKDVSRSINNLYNAEIEFQGGLNYAQPLLWTLDKARIAFSMQFLFSNRTLYQSLRVNSFTLPVRFPIKLPNFTFFNLANIDFSFEREAPVNYKAAVDNLVKNSRDSLEIVTLYATLDNYVKTASPVLTANIFGASVVGDMRNNPFSPTKGYFFALSFDMNNPLFSFMETLSGIAKYTRFQVTSYYFTPLDQFATLSFKQRIGAILWYDRSNSYVPFERQFFAGGANSVRGWQSRQLRYPEIININHSQEQKEFLSNFVGNRVLIEGSFEYRWKLPIDRNAKDIFSEQMRNIGLTAFVDWGNAFNSMELDGNYHEYYTYKWYEYITKLAIASGIGFRYETPVGPLRIDFAWKIYNPSAQKNYWIFDRQNALVGDVSFHLGLGHAF